mmetsp:Transcript_9879/g.17952  ORF Transcript_9879/g.17952 Transcript_9879/m.17952 type:complete len:573 (-) Transcript_9879:851-2569(-)
MTSNNNPISTVSDVEGNKKIPSRQKFPRNSSQSSLDSGGTGGSGRRNARGRGLGRSNSQRSMGGSIGGGGGGLRSSLLSTLSADADSIRDSFLMDDDTIDFSDDSSNSSSSSSSISDMQSHEDGFNSSVASRTKMNFDSFADSFNTTRDNSATEGGGSGGGGKRESAGSSGISTPPTTNGNSGSSSNNDHTKNKPAIHHSNSGECSSNQKNSSHGSTNRITRWSTGDLDLNLDLDIVLPTPFPRPIQHRPIQRATSPLAGRVFSASAPHSSDTTNKLIQRCRTSTARAARGLSQSMTTHSELRRIRHRPRVQAEERRLGVRQALDLSGSIVAYSGTLRGSTSSSEANPDGLGVGDADEPDDDIDEFKATVVLEQIMRAADVGALLQDWNNMIKWSTRLYKELKNGFLTNRGEDPSVGWYENQIKFFDFYVLPLAKNLGVMGVFEDSGVGYRDVSRRGSGGTTGSSGSGSSFFVNCVKSNLAKWIDEGSRATNRMMKDDEEERRKELELRQRQKQQEEEEQQRRRHRQELEEEERQRQDIIDGGLIREKMGSLNLYLGPGGSESNTSADQQQN